MWSSSWRGCSEIEPLFPRYASAFTRSRICGPSRGVLARLITRLATVLQDVSLYVLNCIVKDSFVSLHRIAKATGDPRVLLLSEANRPSDFASSVASGSGGSRPSLLSVCSSFTRRLKRLSLGWTAPNSRRSLS
jgi:hypothetical protein